MTNADKAESMFLEGYNCAQSVLTTCGQGRGLPRKTAIRVAQALGGGIGWTGNMCGALTGALMAIGLECAALEASDIPSKAKAHKLAEAVTAEFARRNGTLLCRELTGCDLRTAEGHQRFTDTDARHKVCAKLVRDGVEIFERILPKQPHA